MKLLASDYDNTLNIGDSSCILRLNINAINEFVQKNKFVLITGRSYGSIKHEISKIKKVHNLNINYDYLSCCDGNVILNKHDGIVYCTSLDTDINSCMIWLQKKHDVIVNPVMFNSKYLEYEIIAPLFDVNLNISIYKICEAYGLSYKETYGYQMKNLHINKVRKIYLGRKDITKSSAIYEISKLENVKKCDIFTIGDEFNDIEMLQDYNGYTFPWCKKEVKNASKGRCLSVAGLVKKISR